MAIEIERKYLVDQQKWKDVEKGMGHYYRQGYMLTQQDKTIRVRATETSGYITIKGQTVGIARTEYEYAIPVADAMEMLDQFCAAIIIKRRYAVLHAGKKWEVDVFEGANEGLVVAEIELNEEGESLVLPPWIAMEVTGDERYYNASLSLHPFKQWHELVR